MEQTSYLTHCPKCDVYSLPGQCNCTNAKVEEQPKAVKKTLKEKSVFESIGSDKKPTGNLLQSFLNS